MKRKIVNGLLLMAVSVSSVSTFVACKDYDEDVYVELKGKISAEQTLREALQKQVDELSAFAHSLKQCECDLQKELADYLKKSEADATYLKKGELEGYITEVAVRQLILEMIQSAEADINAMLEGYATKEDVAKQISDMNDLITSVKATAEEALALAEAAKCECDFTEINGRLDNLDGLVAGWAEQIEDVTVKANSALALAEKDSILIEANKKAIEDLTAIIDNLTGVDMTDITKKLDELMGRYTNEEIDELIGALRSEKEVIDSIANAALELAKEDSVLIDGLDTRVGDLETALEAVVEEIPELKDLIAKANERIDSLAEETLRLDAEIDKLKSDVQNIITGITVQAVESPVAGYLNTPFGLSANILAVYYGTPDHDWEFPSRYGRDYINSADANLWDADALAAIGVSSLDKVANYVSGKADVTLLTQDGWDGNAGTIYVTVNPSNVNFTGKELKLMDSQDNESPAKLSPLQRSNRTLNFGYTRAADNGFYEAQATIHDVEEAKMKVNFNAIQNDIKTLVDNRTSSDVIQLGATVLQSFTDVMPAYGVMGSWTDKSSGTEHKVYSQYNVATTAIQPLGLEFMKDWQGVNSLPGLDELQDLVGQLIDKINLELNLGFDVDDITFEDVDFNEALKSMTVRLTVKPDDSNQIIAEVNGGIYRLTYTNNAVSKAEELQDDGSYADVALNSQDWPAMEDGFVTCNVYIGDSMTGVVEQLGTLQDKLTDLLNQVKGVGSLDASDIKDDLKSSLNSYMTRINNKLLSWINRAPEMLKLALVATSDDKIGMLSQAQSLPTQVSGTINLIPTTYSLEMLAPTYKKFVAVTKAYKNGRNDVAKAKAANANGTNLAEVIQGNDICTLKGEAGYTYEVTYTAIDYFGKIAINKYYVKF